MKRKSKNIIGLLGPIILIHSLGSATETQLPYEEDRSIDLGFISTALIAKAGTPVKLNTDGTVSPIAAVTDVIFGTVYVTNKTLTDKVTVKTQFIAVTKAISDGTVAVGNVLACSGVDGTTGKPKGKVAVATNNIWGVALTGANTGLSITVGILRTNTIKA